MSIWKPHPGPQTKALQSTAFETLYGGARGGGKTDAGLIWLIKPAVLNNPRARALVIRKNADDLSDWLDRAAYFYKSYGAKITGKPAVIRFPGGYKIRTGHLKDDQAYTKYQGQEFQRILIEELTQIPSESQYVKLIGSCRSTVDGVDPRIFCTTNPGGLGHGWVMNRFKTDHMDLYNVKYEAEDTKLTRMFIPAKVEDNPTLIEKNPGYVAYLESIQATDPELYKAWRWGRWDVFAGQFFREFDPRKHVIRPFNPKWNDPKYTFIGGLDWGRTDPFACLLSILFKVEVPGIRPFYRVITFKEYYGTDKSPREWTEEILRGLPMIDPKGDGKLVNALSKVSWIQADTQILAPQNDGSADIAFSFGQAYQPFQHILKPASKERIGGWENLHSWLSMAPDGLPYWLITEDCPNLIRTLPLLVYDENNKQDVDTDGEDHAPDAARYMMKALTWIDARIGGVHSRPASPIRPVSRTAKAIINFDNDKTKVVTTGGWGPV